MMACGSKVLSAVIARFAPGQVQVAFRRRLEITLRKVQISLKIRAHNVQLPARGAWPAIVYPSAPSTVAEEADVTHITQRRVLIPHAFRAHELLRVFYGITKYRTIPMFF